MSLNVVIHAPPTPTALFHFRPGFPTNRLQFARTGSDHFLRRSGSPHTASAVLEANKDASVTHLSAPPVRVVALVGEGSVSPLKSAPWLEVMLHTVRILSLSLYTCIY